MRNWLTGGGIVLVAALLLGVMAGAGSYTANNAQALSYLSDDPKACVNCHIMREAHDTWQKSGHGHVAKCVDCHLPHDTVGKWATKVEHGWNHSVAFTLQNFHEPIQIKGRSLAVVEQNCVGCHRNLLGGVLQAQTAFQNAHTNLDAGQGVLGCVSCHRGVGHGH